VALRIHSGRRDDARDVTNDDVDDRVEAAV
jgi:hypothetical protein